MKIICVGRNYKAHIKELGNAMPEKPVLFMKPDSAIIKNNKPFFLPGFSKEVHHEAEIVLRVCKVGRSIQEKFAHRYYDAVTLGIDFTARDIQREQAKKGQPWEIAKAFDGSAPLGQFIAIDKLPDRYNIGFRLDKNGSVVQEGNTDDLLFGFDYLVSYLSRFFTIKTGDLIYTGTPAGVGPVQVGDRLTGYIEGKMVIDFDIK